MATMSQYNGQDNIYVLTDDIDTEIQETLEIDETKNETFRVKNYILERVNKKFLLASSIIVLFVIIIIILVTSLNKINKMEKKLIKINHPEMFNKKFDNNYPQQDILGNHNVVINDTENPSSTSRKYISDGNNNSEKNVFDAKESTLSDINYSEKIYEKSNTSFSQGATMQDNNTTERMHEESTSYFSQDDSFTKLNSHLPQKISILGNDSIYFFDPNTKEYHLLYKVMNTISAFTAYNKGIIFATETNISRIYYLPNESLNATQRNSTIIFEEPKVKPYAMEIDFITENLYIIDKDMGTLIILNIATKNYNFLLTDLKNPCSVVLDCMEGLMFIVQTADSILRCNMDGRQSMKIVENSGITAITVNENEKRIYWVSDLSNIESSTYDGKNRKLFLKDSFHIGSLTTIKDQLFWLCPTDGLTIATLLFSKSDNGSSVSTPSLEIIHILKNPKSIKFILYQNQNISNSFHHRCQHIGMQTPGHGYNCTCNIGWQLHSDWHSCRLVTDFILYNKGNFIRGSMLDINKASALDVIWPTQYHVESLNNKNGIHFSYDLRNDDFYFSDDRHLYKMKLKARFSNQTMLFTIDQRNSVLQDVVFDWFTGNVYYIIRSLQNNPFHKIKIFNIKLGIDVQKTLTTLSYLNNLPFTGCPYALIVNPNRYSLYYTKFDFYHLRTSLRNVKYVRRNDMKIRDLPQDVIRDDITIFTDINTFGLVIAIDYINDKIYRILESDLNTRISYTTYDGMNGKSFIVESVSYVKFIDVHQRWLYLSNGTSIWRVHKETGKDAVKIIPSYEDNIYQRITAIKIISPSIQFTKSKNNSCLINNGNCEQFCFHVPEITCDCKDKKRISRDGRHCI